MKQYKKSDFPVADVRRLLEPGPIVLVSSAHKDVRNIMTLGWHTVLEFSPSLIGCMITSANESFEIIRKSGECVINIPTTDMVDTVVKIGNVSQSECGDKFEAFGLTPTKASKVNAPMIAECFASFECRIHDKRMIKDYNFFIFEVVKAHVSSTARRPDTLHYHGQGVFSTDGNYMNKARLFTKWRATDTF
ncbi:flavin reductase family protein [Micavibrio aeruginosavorus]|uniref:Flavoredoxin n=1 Tax=Micavibrio aeruginosavorus EPB TaxID=349215 RepID=M4VJS1_9BACT|nr:flavin reductase family protein [Micavibrio aeruginosavorus]AGH98745.1 Flavoredoxin [Micavibrio aeruginosavorus EPB]